MNPYLVVGSPNYAAPLLNFGQGGQGANPGAPNNNQTNNNQPNNQISYAQLLQKIFGGGNGQNYAPNGPMQLQGSPGMMAQGNPTQPGSIY